MPTSKLEVAGQIATTSGYKFADGTVQTTAAEKGTFFPNATVYTDSLYSNFDLDLSSVVGNNKAQVLLKISSLDNFFSGNIVVAKSKDDLSDYPLVGGSYAVGPNSTYLKFLKIGDAGQLYCVTDSNGRINIKYLENSFQTRLALVKIEVLMYMK